jgi:hypothetical protein
MQVGEVCVGVLRAACRRVADNIIDSVKQPSAASKTAGENEKDAKREEAGMRERSGKGESRERKGRKEKTKKTRSELRHDLDLTSEDEEEEEDDVVEKEEDGREDSEKEEDEDEDDTSTNEDSESEDRNDAEEDKSDRREIIVQDRYCPPLPASLSYEHTNSVGSVQQQTGAFQEVLVTVFKHPVIQNWLFAEGFLQHSSVRRAVFEKLCSFVKELSELDEASTHADSSSSDKSRSFSIDSLCNVRSKCAWLVQHVPGAQCQQDTSPSKGKAKSPKSSKKGKSPSSKKEETKEDVQDSDAFAKSVQSALALCLDALFSVCDDAAKLKGLLEIVKSGPENFIAEAGSSEPSPLGKTVVSLAEALTEKAVENWLKNGLSRDESLAKKSGAALTGDGGAESGDGSDSPSSTDTNFTASIQGLLSLAASLKSAAIDSLTLTFVQHFPASSSACLLSTFDLLFTRALSEQSSGVQGLVESLLRNSPECFAICRKRLKKWRKMDNAGHEYASIMLLYLGLVLKRQGKLSVCCCYCVNVKFGCCC